MEIAQIYFQPKHCIRLRILRETDINTFNLQGVQDQKLLFQ